MSNLEKVLASRRERLIDYMVVLGPQIVDGSFSRDITRARSDSTSIDPIYELFVLGKDDTPEPDWSEVMTVGKVSVDINLGLWNPPRRQFYSRVPRLGGISVPITNVHIHSAQSKTPVESCWRMVNSKPYGRHDLTIYVEHDPDGAPLLDQIILDPTKNDLIPQSYMCCDDPLNNNVGGKRFKQCYRVKSRKTETSTSTFSALLHGRYPTTDLPGNPLDVAGQSHLCFPSGISISQTMQLPTFLTFVSTKLDGSEVYGAALTCYDRLPATVCICNDPEFAECCPKHATDPHRRMISQLKYHSSPHSNDPLFVSHCLCLISRWPFLTPFKALLEQLYRVSLNYSIEPFILRLLLHTRLPKPSLSHFVLPVGHAKITFTLPPRMSLPKLAAASGLSLMEIFSCLSVANIISVWRHLIVEGRVLLFSQNHTLLAPVAEAFRSLLSPLQWQCIFIPILPLSMASVIRAPFPFLVGVHRGFLDQVRVASDILLVDLDSNKLRFPQHNDENVTNSNNLVLSDPPLELKHGAKIGSNRYNPPYHPQLPTLVFTRYCRRNGPSIHAPSLPEELYAKLERKLHMLLPLFGKRNDGATSSHSYIPENDFSSYIDADFYEDLTPLMPQNVIPDQDVVNLGIPIGITANPMYRKDAVPDDTSSRLQQTAHTKAIEVPKSLYTELGDLGGLVQHQGKVAVSPSANAYMYTASSLDAARGDIPLPKYVLLQTNPLVPVERTLYGDGVESSYASGLSCAQFREVCIRLEFFDVFCSLVGKHTQRHIIQSASKAIDWRVDAGVNSGLHMTLDTTPYATYLKSRSHQAPAGILDLDSLVSSKLGSGNSDMQSLLLPSPVETTDSKKKPDVLLAEALQSTQFFAEWINSYLYPSCEVPLPQVLPTYPHVRNIATVKTMATNARHMKRGSISNIDVSSLTSSPSSAEGTQGIVRGEFSHEHYNTSLDAPYSFSATPKPSVGLTTTTISSAYHKILLMNILYELNHAQHYPSPTCRKRESGLSQVLTNVHVTNNNLQWPPYNSLVTPRFQPIRQSSTATASSVFLRTGQWGLTLQSQSFFAKLAKKYRNGTLQLIEKADDFIRNSTDHSLPATQSYKEIPVSPLLRNNSNSSNNPPETKLCPWSIVRLLQWPSILFGQDAPVNANNELSWIDTDVNTLDTNNLAPFVQLLSSMDCSAMTSDILLTLAQRLYKGSKSIENWTREAIKNSTSDVQYQWLGRFTNNTPENNRSGQMTPLLFKEQEVEKLYNDSVNTPCSAIHGWGHILPLTLQHHKAEVNTLPLSEAVDSMLKHVPNALSTQHEDFSFSSSYHDSDDDDISDADSVYMSEDEVKLPSLHTIYQPCSEVLALHSYGEATDVLIDALSAPLALLSEVLLTPAISQLSESQRSEVSAIQREFTSPTGDVIVHGVLKTCGWGISADVGFMDAAKTPVDAGNLDGTIGQELPCILDQIATSPISPQNAYTNSCAPTQRVPSLPCVPLSFSSDTSITVPIDFQSISPPHTAPLSLTPTSPLSWLMTSVVTSSVHDQWTYLYVSRPTSPLSVVQHAMSYSNGPCTSQCINQAACQHTTSSKKKQSLFNIQNTTKTHHTVKDISNTQHIISALVHLAVGEMKHSEQQVQARIEKHLNHSANCASLSSLIETGFVDQLQGSKTKISSFEHLHTLLPSLEPNDTKAFASQYPSVGSIVTQIRLAAEKDVLVLLTQLTHQITRRCIPLASTVVTILQYLQILGMERAASSLKSLLQNNCVDFSWSVERLDDVSVGASNESSRSLRFAEKSVSHRISDKGLSSPMPVPQTSKAIPVWSGLTLRRSIGLTGLVSLAGASAGYMNINSSTHDVALCSLANHLNMEQNNHTTPVTATTPELPIVTPSPCLPWPVQTFMTASCPKCKLELSTSEVLASYSQHLHRHVSLSATSAKVNPFVDDAIECWRCTSHMLPKVTVVFDGSPCAREYCDAYYRSSPFTTHAVDSDSESSDDEDLSSKVVKNPLYITQPLVSPLRIRGEIDNLLLSHTYSPDAFIYEGGAVGAENIFTTPKNVSELSTILRYNFHKLFDEQPSDSVDIPSSHASVEEEASLPFTKPFTAQGTSPSPLSVVRAHPSLLWSCFYFFSIRDSHYTPQASTLPVSSISSFLPGCNTPGSMSIPAADPVTSDILGGKTSLLVPNTVTSVQLLLSDAPLALTTPLDLPSIYNSTTPTKVNEFPTYIMTQPSGGTWVVYRDGYKSCPCHKNTCNSEENDDSDDDSDASDDEVARHIDPLRVNLPHNVLPNEQQKFWKCKCASNTTPEELLNMNSNPSATPSTVARREVRNTICSALFPYLRMVTDATPLAPGLGNSGTYRIAEYLRTTTGDGSLNTPCRIALIARLTRNTIHMLLSSQKRQKTASTCTCVEEMIEVLPKTHSLYSKKELQALQSYHIYFHPKYKNVRTTTFNPYHGCPNPAAPLHDFSHFTSKSSLMNTLRQLDAPVAMPPSYPGEAASENTARVPLVLRKPHLPRFLKSSDVETTGSPLCYNDLMNSPRPRPFYRFLHSYAKTMQWLRLQSSSAALTAALKPAANASSNKSNSITGGTMNGLYLYPALSSPAMRSGAQTAPTPPESSTTNSGTAESITESTPIPLLASHAEIALHSASKTPMHKLAREIQAHDYMFSACFLSFVGSAESLWSSIDLQSGCNNGIGIWTLSNPNISVNPGKHLFWSSVPILEELETTDLPQCCERADDEKELAMFKDILTTNMNLYTTKKVSFNAVNTRLYAILLSVQKLQEDLNVYTKNIDVVNLYTSIADKKAYLDTPAGALDLAAKLVLLSQHKPCDVYSILQSMYVYTHNSKQKHLTPPLFPLQNSNPQIGRGTNIIATIEDLRVELQKRKKRETALNNSSMNISITANSSTASIQSDIKMHKCEIELTKLCIDDEENSDNMVLSPDGILETPQTSRVHKALQVCLPIEPKLDALTAGFFLATPDIPTLRLLRKFAYYSCLRAGLSHIPMLFAACSWDHITTVHDGIYVSPLSLLVFFQVFVKGIRDLMGSTKSELKPRVWETQAQIDTSSEYPLCSVLGLKPDFPFPITHSRVNGNFDKKEQAVELLCQCAAEIIRTYIEQQQSHESSTSFITVKALQLPTQLDVYLRDFDTFPQQYKACVKDKTKKAPWDDILGTSMLLGEIAYNWMQDTVQTWIATCFRASKSSESVQAISTKSEGSSITNIMRARARAGSQQSQIYANLSPPAQNRSFEPPTDHYNPDMTIGSLRLEDLTYEDSYSEDHSKRLTDSVELSMESPPPIHRRSISNTSQPPPTYGQTRRLAQSVGIYKLPEDRTKEESFSNSQRKQ